MTQDARHHKTGLFPPANVLFPAAVLLAGCQKEHRTVSSACFVRVSMCSELAAGRSMLPEANHIRSL